MKWLFFSYSLPAEPSKARVYVWRQLKKLGAVNVQSVWALPHSVERITEVKKLIEEIAKFKGESLLVEGKAVVKAQAEMIQQKLMESRNEEYEELIEKCEDYFKEITKEIECQNFIFAEVEEYEEELEKLKKWLKKVEKRDVIDTPMRKTAIEKIRICEKMFEDFAKKVFTHLQGIDGPNKIAITKTVQKRRAAHAETDTSSLEPETNTSEV